MGCGASAAQDKYKQETTAGQGGGTDKSTRDYDKKTAKEENKDFSQKMQFLSKVPLLKRLQKDQLPFLAECACPVEINAATNVIKQNDNGNEFFVIMEGVAKVIQNDCEIAELKSGDYFGEGALLADEPRAATIAATSNLKLLKIKQSDFKKLGLDNKLQWINRKAVAGGGGTRKVAEKKEPTAEQKKKTEAEKKLITEALKKNKNLETMVTLDEKRIKSMIDVAWKEEVAKDHELISQGDLNADFFYIVQSGKFYIKVETNDEKQGSVIDEEGWSGPGESFGELALLYLVPRAATVKAEEKSEVWVIDRQNFKNILMRVSEGKIQEYVKYLDNTPILEPLIQDEKKALAQALVEMHFTKDETIVQEGEAGSTFYILYDGNVDIIIEGKGTVNKLEASASKGKAEYFGEKALLENDVRNATVKVTSSSAKALALDRTSFDMLLGPLSDIMKRNKDNQEQRSSHVKTGKPGASQNPNDVCREKIPRKQLNKVGLLGCGGFGSVDLYEHKESGKTFAMKALSKGYICKTGMQDSVMNEKNILMMTNSPFIIKLFECYNGSQTLYFLMEPALGGELYATYNRKGFHGSDKHAKFYCAGVVFAFEHMHERRIIYRDLKPENLLLSEKGEIKLTDMGLAKFVIGKTYTTCGTPDYFAPELIASTGHTDAVDWWTLGILTFELMSGHPPFESAYPMQIYSKVMKGISKVPFPPKCQGAVGELIKSLLKKEPSERLPMKKDGHTLMREAKWWSASGFDWKAMENLTLEPPYKPTVKSKKDIANFSARKEDMPRQIEYRDDGSNWDKDFATHK